MTSEPNDITRRALLSRVAVALGAFLSAALGIPVIGAAISPAGRREEAPWITLGPLSGFAIGEPRMVQFGISRPDGYLTTNSPRSVWVYRPDANNLLVYNARCTHLGCLVNYRSESASFLSPCHGGVFAASDGHVVDGPPPRPLDRLDHRMDGEVLQVQYRDFLVGVPNQVAL
ncbi:MAG: menaquinol-cytochrome c reductase iron-sulfur subunit [Chloroflexi bacterium]|nr:menaquinol-cytochrome c reductase iron-sulfur subunit [Chloroflexota bacterium]